MRPLDPAVERVADEATGSGKHVQGKVGAHAVAVACRNRVSAGEPEFPAGGRRRDRIRVINGDCASVIGQRVIAPKSVNLIVTSPPYADQRKDLYGGIHPDEYVEWFLSKASQFQRVLTDDGSFVLNIKEKAINGERHTYVLNLILSMRDQGWRWVEEYCWHKKNCYPGKWPNRFRDSWERCLHFTLSKKFKMRQESVMVPMGSWKDSRLNKLSETDKVRDESSHGNGFGKKVKNWVGRDMAYPTNVLHMATECGYQRHPATFPVGLPAWFIRLFTDEGDTVLDPFAGSGTTLVAALRLNRMGIGVDISRDYCNLMNQRLKNVEP